MIRRDFQCPSTDGVHTLSGVIYAPEGKPKALFHLVHGMTEYIDRYDPLMRFLAEQGYLVFGYDHLGHGKTVKNAEELGFIAHKDGWRYLVRDVAAAEDTVREQYPDLPLFLMGHSMGSFIVRLAATEQKDRYAGLVVCGTGGPNPAALLGLLLCDILKLFYGEKHLSPLAESVAFGSYNKRFEGLSKYDWLTKNRDVITAYEKDPLCNFSFTVSALHDLVKLNRECNLNRWFDAFPKALPVLLIAGADDPVGDYGKGVETVARKLKAQNVQEIETKLYENCRHEIHNDTCRDEMFGDILRFCDGIR